jgi:hypothetical protein
MHMYASMRACMHVCVFMYIYIHAYIHTYMHTHTHTNTHICTHTLFCRLEFACDYFTYALGWRTNSCHAVCRCIRPNWIKSWHFCCVIQTTTTTTTHACRWNMSCCCHTKNKNTCMQVQHEVLSPSWGRPENAKCTCVSTSRSRHTQTHAGEAGTAAMCEGSMAIPSGIHTRNPCAKHIWRQ